MAKASAEIVAALHLTANRLEHSECYQWGHMGSCNCGFLVQEITHLDRNYIHQSAMQRSGDWSEQLNDYCSKSGLKIDDIIESLLHFGFTTDDLKHLERLSDPAVLLQLPTSQRNLRHNYKADVILYLRTWSELIERAMWAHGNLTARVEVRKERSPSPHYSDSQI